MTTFDPIPEPELTPPPSPGAVVPALQLKNVSKSFGSVLAVRDISLHVDPGTVTCVLGDNGAGKSTLIKILSGVHQASRGGAPRQRRADLVLLAARRARRRHRHGLSRTWPRCR